MSLLSRGCRNLVAVVIVVGAWVALPSSASAGQALFTFTGSEQTFTVPVGVYSLQVEAAGGRGGNGAEGGGAGARGALVTGTIAVTPGQSLFIDVGGNGGSGGIGSSHAFNGGGAGVEYGAGGGGASDVRAIPAGLPASLDSRLLIAGGGGGGGGGTSSAGGAGGAGGTEGEDGTDASVNAHGGGGGEPGTQSAGGAGGTGGSGNSIVGAGGGSGEYGEGGNAVGGISGGGGGGGGGLYGGGAGGTGGRSTLGENAGGGGGGGGSSLMPQGGTVSVAGPGTNSHVLITFEVSGPAAVLGKSIALAPDRALLLGTGEGFKVPVTAHFEYGTNTTYGHSTPESTPALTVSASAIVEGLQPGTTYHYRLVVTRADGLVARSPDGKIKTPAARPRLRLLTKQARLSPDGKVVLRLRCGKESFPCRARLTARWPEANGAVRRTLALKPGALYTLRLRVSPVIQRLLKGGSAEQLRLSLVGLEGTRVSPKRRTLTIPPAG